VSEARNGPDSNAEQRRSDEDAKGMKTIVKFATERSDSCIDRTTDMRTRSSLHDPERRAEGEGAEWCAEQDR
jgi:hypothetical protein